MQDYIPLAVRPLTLKEANLLVAQWHRHHKPAQGHRFSLGVYDKEGAAHGAAIVGRPVARHTEQYVVAEVTRLVSDGTKNACSMLYAHCAQAAQAMGFQRIQTFILESEPGTSLKASGWERGYVSRSGDGWARSSSRHREVGAWAAENKVIWWRIFREADAKGIAEAVPELEAA